MITLAKRPQPRLGATPAPSQYTETDYATLMRRRARMEGHRPNHNRMQATITNEDRFAPIIAAFKSGAKSVVDVMLKRGSVDYESNYRAIKRMQNLGLVTRHETKPLTWSLK
jgi:hypothetical protein